MYIRKIVSKNLGPIKKIQLLLPLENGVPKPVVLVGENGTGKSTLISNVVDSFYEIAGAAYPDMRLLHRNRDLPGGFRTCTG